MADEKKEAGEAKSSPSTMKIVIIAVIASVILSGAMVGGAMMFMGGDDATAAEGAEGEAADPAEKTLGPPQYHSMDPKFVISFSDQRRARFMQFSLQLMTRDNDVMKMLDAHMPAIRSNLLMLFGSQKYEDMVTREGKQKLLKDIVKDVNATLVKIAEETGEKPGVVNAAYFDSFVIQ